MIVDMQGNPVQDSGPSPKRIEIDIDPRLEDNRLDEFVNNFLYPFLIDLQVPFLRVEIL
jgi:hypothetical protein